MDLFDLFEAVEVNGSRISEITTRRQFQAALRRHPDLRAFIDTRNDIIIAWDAYGAVHPDVRNETGDFGVPVHMDVNSIRIRPHGLPIGYVKQMYREIIASPVVRRVYNGVLPSIHIDDEDTIYDRIDNLGWEMPGEHDDDEDEGDRADGTWRDHWHSY